MKSRRDRTSALRARIAKLHAEITILWFIIERAERPEPPAERATVEVRIGGLLSRHPTMRFMPAEIMEAIGAREDSTRGALTKLVKVGSIMRVGHGRYQDRSGALRAAFER